MQQNDRISKLEAQLARKNKELEQWKQKYVELATKSMHMSSSTGANAKYNPLMDDIQPLLNCRREYVKSLVSDGKILMNDTDKDGTTLLMFASVLGHYDMAQLCVNLGSDIDHENRFGNTAIDYARGSAWHHCEQLLLFSKLNANVSDDVQNIAFNMNKQNGIIDNVINELNNVIKDKNEQNKFMATLTRIICNIITKKLSFSDDLLNLCWIYNNTGTSKHNENYSNKRNNLWIALMNTCNDIIENGNKKDWYYFQTFILASNVCN